MIELVLDPLSWSTGGWGSRSRWSNFEVLFESKRAALAERRVTPMRIVPALHQAEERQMRLGV